MFPLLAPASAGVFVDQRRDGHSKLSELSDQRRSRRSRVHRCDGAAEISTVSPSVSRISQSRSRASASHTALFASSRLLKPCRKRSSSPRVAVSRYLPGVISKCLCRDSQTGRRVPGSFATRRRAASLTGRRIGGSPTGSSTGLPTGWGGNSGYQVEKVLQAPQPA